MKAGAVRLILAVGAAGLSMSVLAHLSGYARFNTPVLVVFAGLWFGLFLLLRAVLFNWIFERTTEGKAWIVLMVALFTGVAIQQVLPLRADAFPKAEQLQLTNTGQRNSNSKGNEIWAKVLSAKGTVIKPIQPLPAGWELKDDGTVVSTQATPAPVTWRVKLDSGASLNATRHGWSGIGEMYWAGRSRQLDLYEAEGASAERVALEGRSAPSALDRAIAWVVAAADAATLAFLLLLLLLQFVKRSHENQSS